MERYIRENDLEIFRDKNISPDIADEFDMQNEVGFPGCEVSPSIGANSIDSKESAQEHLFSAAANNNAVEGSGMQREEEARSRGSTQEKQKRGNSAHQKCNIL